MTDALDLIRKRKEHANKQLVNAFLAAKKEGVEIVYFDPYLILYEKLSKSIQVLRLDQLGLRKMFLIFVGVTPVIR